MRWRVPFDLHPEPPPAGRVLLADPRAVRRRWLLFLALVAGAAAVLWPRGLGRAVDQMRRDVVAAGYLKAATAHAVSRPAQRAEALHDLERCLAAAPDQGRYGEAVGSLYLQLRAYGEARNWLGRQAGGGALVRISLAHCLLMTGETEAGLEALAEALARVTRERAAGAVSAQAHALALNNVGYALAEAGVDLPQARALTARALASSPLEPAFVDTMGWAEFRLGRFPEAVFLLERAVRLYLPDEHAEVYYHLGMAYAKLGRPHGARQALTRCLELDPSWAEAWRELKGLRQALPPPAVAAAPTLARAHHHPKRG